jgi:hypothetical protein
MVIEAGEKAKLEAVMVWVALGGAVVVVARVVVVETVVVGVWLVVVVGGRVVVGGTVVVGAVVVVGGWVEVVAAVVTTVDDASGAVVVARVGTVEVAPTSESSVDPSVAPSPQAISRIASSNKRLCILRHTQQGSLRFPGPSR